MFHFTHFFAHNTIVLQYLYNRHQCNTDDGKQAMGEKLRHVQMSR